MHIFGYLYIKIFGAFILNFLQFQSYILPAMVISILYMRHSKYLTELLL